MNKYTAEQSVLIVKLFYQNNKSIIQTQRAYRRYCGVRDSPSEFGIRSLIKQFDEHGMVHDRTIPRPCSYNWYMIVHNQEGLALPGLRKRLNRLGTASEKIQFASGPHRLWCHEVPCRGF